MHIYNFKKCSPVLTRKKSLVLAKSSFQIWNRGCPTLSQTWVN